METSPITPQDLSKLTEGETFWKRHLELQKLSGLSRVQYCREHTLNYHRFGYWLSKWSRETSSPLITVKLKPERSFEHEVTLCTLNLSNGRTLCIHDKQALIFILEKLS